MNVPMHRHILAALVSGLVCLAPAYAADPDEVVPSMWKPQRIEVPYHAFTTAYDCRALEDKVEHILQTLGAHENTRVRATGCEFDRVSRTIFLRITTAAPVEATAEYKEELAKDKSRQELITRLGGKNQMNMEEFPGVWKRVELSRDRKLDLEPGDCELMETLRDRVFPKMSIKVVQDEVRCTPNQLSMSTPLLTVQALTKAPSPDTQER
ncbi:MAG TPA: hypothetical protein VFZ51_04715 [Woeseiaceae bacterium]